MIARFVLIHHSDPVGDLAAPAQQYLSGASSEVRRSYPETDFKLVNLSPGEQIIALRAGEIDVGITNDSGEFYTRTLTEVGSCIALQEQHRLSTQDQVGLSDLKGEFFLAWDSQQEPGLDRQVQAYCKKYGGERASTIPSWQNTRRFSSRLSWRIANAF